MKESISSLIRELCCNLSLSQEDVNDNPERTKCTKQIISKAFEILLESNKAISDDYEDCLEMVTVDISGHIYCRAKAQGKWNSEMKEAVSVVTDKLEVLASQDTAINPVLRLLLCLADSAPPQWQERPYIGLDINTLITDDYRHRSLLKYHPGVNSSMFELLPPLKTFSNDLFDLHKFNDTPGTGLRHQEFFTSPVYECNFSSNRLKDIDEHDICNANWIFPKLSARSTSVNNALVTARVGVQDEGYVTPDQDLNISSREGEVDYQWEHICEEEFNPFYSWESFGSFLKKKELPFISQERTAADHLWKVVHAFNTTTSIETGNCKPVCLKATSFQEIEVAFKNLLIGIESTMFHYDLDEKTFVLKEGLHLKGSSAQSLRGYCTEFIECANYFRYLNAVTQETDSLSAPTDYGLMYQVLCSNTTCYLQCYRRIVLKMPSLKCLLQTHNWLHKLRTQLQFLVDLVRSSSVARGGALLAHLYNQLPLVTRSDLTFILYYILQSCTKVYFELMKKWMFEGECHSFHNELFIESCSLEEMDRRFWSRGFTLNKLLVPGFLKDLEGDIFVCGKNMALLKICAPDDPAYVLVKKGYPSIDVCLNKTHVRRVEELFSQYSERYKALCREVLEETAAEPCQDEEYYANLRAATLKRIHEAQEKEKRQKIDKKRLELEILRKNFEEAESRKKEDKQKLLEEDEKLLKEAEEADKLYNLRLEEERQKLVRYYAALSEAADRRKEKAEWKIKRSKLHEKRVKFLKNTENTEHFYGSDIVKKETNELMEDAKASDLTGIHDEASSSKQITDTNVEPQEKQNIVETKQSSHLKTEDRLDLKTNELNDEQRDWLIALDVAEQARHSAARFKERNMFNDYNLVTGETHSYASRFGNKLDCDDAVDSQETVTAPVELVNPVLSVSPDSAQNDSLQTSINSSTRTQSNEVIKSNYILNGSKEQKTTENKSFCRENNESLQYKSNSSDVLLETPLDFESNLNLDEINITSIDQNLRMSVMIPLQAQLRISNEAVLRLLLVKHNLFKHLECIKTHFFLEGEFGRNLTQDLFSEVQTVVKNGQDPSYVLNVPRLNSLLRSSIRISSDEEYTERLSFFVRKIPPVFRLIDPNMLDCLSIRYKTHWPMNIIVTDGTILKLDIVFTFLMKLHRVSWALGDTVYLLKDRRLDGSKQFKEVQLFRHIMSHFVNSLKTYLATTLEGCWYQFSLDFKKVRTLNEIYDLYVKYINRLHFRCLLNKKAQPMGSHLTNVFSQILRFYEGLRKGVWAKDSVSGQFHHSGYRSLAHAFGNFMKEARYLYHYTKPSVQSAYQSQLVQLHSLLSGNDFYDSH